MQIKVIKPSVERMQERKKVCAYVRVSTDSDEQEDSYENQMHYYKDKIESNPEWEFVGIYSDLGISGYKEKRPGFLNMIKDARDGRVDLILVKSISRFARNTETVLKYSRELKRLGVGIYFELQKINTLSGEGELLLTILAAFAQAESESNSGNVSMSIRRKFEKGELNFPISKIYGYTEDADGNPIIDEEKAKIVRLIFDLAEKGIWVTKISEYLNRKQIPGIAAEKWNYGQVAKMLRQEAYMGDRILQKTYRDSRRRTRKNKGQVDQWYVKGTHPAIVTREQWYRVQDILLERNKELYDATPISEEKNLSTHSTYPLSGMLYCPYCGRVLMHRWEGKKRYENWVCGLHRKVSKDACPGICIPNQIASSWGELKEPMTVLKYTDEYGMERFTAIPKVEYEASEDCPYEVVKPEPKPERPKKPFYKKAPKPEKPRYTRNVYPLSGKLFCPNCGKVLTHKWNKGVEYWVCSTNRNKHRTENFEKCKGMYFPAEAAKDWGEINEPLTVIAYKNEYGHRLYTAMPKEEYERSADCPYRKED